MSDASTPDHLDAVRVAMDQHGLPTYRGYVFDPWSFTFLKLAPTALLDRKTYREFEVEHRKDKPYRHFQETFRAFDAPARAYLEYVFADALLVFERDPVRVTLEPSRDLIAQQNALSRRDDTRTTRFTHRRDPSFDFDQWLVQIPAYLKYASAFLHPEERDQWHEHGILLDPYLGEFKRYSIDRKNQSDSVSSAALTQEEALRKTTRKPALQRFVKSFRIAKVPGATYVATENGVTRFARDRTLARTEVPPATLAEHDDEAVRALAKPV